MCHEHERAGKSWTEYRQVLFEDYGVGRGQSCCMHSRRAAEFAAGAFLQAAKEVQEQRVMVVQRHRCDTSPRRRCPADAELGLSMLSHIASSHCKIRFLATIAAHTVRSVPPTSGGQALRP